MIEQISMSYKNEAKVLLFQKLLEFVNLTFLFHKTVKNLAIDLLSVPAKCVVGRPSWQYLQITFVFSSDVTR